VQPFLAPFDYKVSPEAGRLSRTQGKRPVEMSTRPSMESSWKLQQNMREMALAYEEKEKNRLP
jgi:hypothetical protein